jgi:hypothetical protein
MAVGQVNGVFEHSRYGGLKEEQRWNQLAVTFDSLPIA